MKTIQMKNLITAFCILLIISIDFWACRKQDYKTNDLQIASKELQTWLAVNGEKLKKGDLLTKNSKGELTKASLNWAEIKHTSTINKDFYEVPFVFENNASGETNTLGIDKKENPTAYKILFQKNINGDIAGRVVIITTEDIALSKQYQTKSFDKIYLFDDFKGNRKSSWVGLGNNVFSEVFKTNTANESATLATNNKSATTSIGLNGSGCSIFTSTTSELDCWHTPGGNTYDMTCGYITGRTVIFTICGGGDGGGGDESIDYSGFLGTSGSGGNNTSTQQNNIATINEIKDSLENECLKKAWNSLYSKGVSDSIVSFLNNTFLGTSKFNIVITQEANLIGSNGNSLDGHTIKVFDPNTGVLNITLQLNSSTLPDATQEFTTATILHEILHAYLSATSRLNKIEQENDIALKYVATIFNSLKNNFPNFPDDKAWAIAWGGLDGTPVWNNNLTQAQKDSFLKENNYQHAGVNGTKCK